MESIICAQKWSTEQPKRDAWYGKFNAFTLKYRWLKPLERSRSCKLAIETLEDLGLSPTVAFRIVFGAVAVEQWGEPRGVTTAIVQKNGRIAFETMFSDGTAIVSTPTPYSDSIRKSGSTYLTFRDVATGYMAHEREVEKRLESGYTALERRSVDQIRAFSEWYNRNRSSSKTAYVTLMLLSMYAAGFAYLSFAFFA